MQPLKLSLVTKSVPVEIASADGKSVGNYTLNEISALSRDEHNDLVLSRTRFDKEGKPAGVTTMKGFQTDLVSRCLLLEDGTKVPITVINSWPSDVVRSLYDAARELNSMDKAEEDEGPASPNA